MQVKGGARHIGAWARLSMRAGTTCTSLAETRARLRRPSSWSSWWKDKGATRSSPSVTAVFQTQRPL